MKTLLTIVLFSFSTFSINTDISMVGIKINDNENLIDKINLKVIGNETNGKIHMIKYRTENGNDLAITLKKGKVVYMENDWLHDNFGKQPLITNFQFGITSLREIRKTFGTNGFGFKKRGPFTTETDLIEFNCFEVASPNNEVLVTITKVSLNANVTEENVSDSLKLESIIIANNAYLEELWGKEKLYDNNYKKIKL
jgi:hypothetical protein